MGSGSFVLKARGELLREATKLELDDSLEELRRWGKQILMESLREDLQEE